MLVILTLLLASQCMLLHGQSPPKVLKMGFLVPFGGGWDGGRRMAGAMPLAVERINSDPNILKDYTLEYIWRDSRCNAGKSLAAMSELLDLGVDVFIGPGCSAACEVTQWLASNRGLFQVKKSNL